MKRCGKCANCLKLEKVKHSVLACCGTPPKALYGGQFNHADDGVVQVWNDQLKNLPCLEKKS